jgi:hypothetical protein
MALEAAFKELYANLHKLHEGVIGLRTTVVEDKPLSGDIVLVDVFGDASDDLLGWLEEALADVREGQQAATYPVDLDRARRALTTCQEQFNRISQRFSSDLICYERIADLTHFGRKRGGEWHAWAASVKHALDGCQQALYASSQTLFRCWQEIAERVGMNSVSVQATNIGQQITVSDGSTGATDEIP